MLTYDYDNTSPGPALPIVEIVLRGLTRDSRELVCRALIDSGADATVIPVRYLQELKARKVDTKQLRGMGGLRYQVDIYEIALRLGVYTIAKVYAVADKQNTDVILGRDVLNQFIVTLNGLASMVEITQ